jgi:transcriptional regulator with XRE-family HTH domain
MQVLPDDAVAVAAAADVELPSARRALTAVPDRATREAAAAIARIAYCAQLKELREHRGVKLADIAERTKVNEGLYVALERADVSRWPTGIYRRSFFRAYALALGLPVDSALSEFQQLFPDEGEQRTSSALATAPGPLRMTFENHAWLRPSRVQTLASVVDLIVVAVITAAIVWWLPIAIGTAAAVVAVIYYSLATACLACSPGTWWLRIRGNRKRAKALRLAR